MGCVCSAWGHPKSGPASQGTASSDTPCAAEEPRLGGPIFTGSVLSRMLIQGPSPLGPGCRAGRRGLEGRWSPCPQTPSTEPGADRTWPRGSVPASLRVAETRATDRSSPLCRASLCSGASALRVTLTGTAQGHGPITAPSQAGGAASSRGPGQALGSWGTLAGAADGTGDVPSPLALSPPGPDGPLTTPGTLQKPERSRTSQSCPHPSWMADLSSMGASALCTLWLNKMLLSLAVLGPQTCCDSCVVHVGGSGCVCAEGEGWQGREALANTELLGQRRQVRMGGAATLLAEEPPGTPFPPSPSVSQLHPRVQGSTNVSESRTE